MKYLKFILSIAFAPIYIFIFKVFNLQSNQHSVNSLINSYILSGGYINSVYDFFLKKSSKDVKNNSSYSINGMTCEHITKQINKNGFIVIENFIHSDLVDELLLEIKSMHGKYRSDNKISQHSEKFDLNNPRGARFDYLAEEILTSRVIQSIIFNKAILKIANVYLKAIPILDIVNLWWSTPTKNADKEAAQWWHFDMDRTNWLKYFIYFTNCDSDSGPHQFISGTHKNFGVPWNLRRKGYTRLSDNEILLNFNSDDIKTFTAKSGTLLIENTRGLHRGQKLKKNSRLLLQVEFTTNLFGGKFEKYPIKKSTLTNSSLKFFKDNKFTYKNFRVK